MKKFLVKDEDEGYVVEELTEDEEVEEEKVEEIDDAESLTEEEISALKALAAVSEKLVALVNAKEDEPVMEDEDEDEELMEDEDEDEDEEVLDTETCVPTHDSKKSFGSIKKKSLSIDDSIEEDEVSKAWANRYGGK